MPQDFECPECGNSYDSERGLHIHIGQKHKDKKEEILSKLDEGGTSEAKDVMDISLIPSPKRLATYAVIALVLVGAIFLFTQNGFNLLQGDELTTQQASDRVETFLTNIPQLQGADVSASASDTESGVYELNVSVSSDQGTQSLTNYMTKDGSLLFPSAQTAEAEEGLTPQEAGQKAAETLNSLQQIQLSNMTVTFSEYLGEVSGVYSITLTLTAPQGNQSINSYVTKDGKYVFSDAVNMTEQLKQAEEQTQTQQSEDQQMEVKDIQNKTDKPTVELFVMSFCPYGNQAENTMEPVYELLGDRVNWEPHYIVNENSNGELESLHGQPEVEQDKREVCVLENNGVGKWFDFVTYVNDNCGSEGECWEEAAQNVGLNPSNISSCAQERGTELLKEEANIASEKGASGSPTLIINGQNSNVVYQYDNPEAYKSTICSAFSDQPDVCGTQLSGTSEDANTQAASC